MRPVSTKYGITLGYRQKPKSPALKNYIHRGVDYGTPTGTAANATIGGTVVHAGRGGMGPAFGIHVVILTDGVWHLYAHLSRADVKRGQVVRLGDHIGLTGATGNVTGAHLHYAEFTRYHYQADRAPKFLNVTASSGPTVVTAIQNMAGNNAHGIKTGKARATAYANKRRAIRVDVLLTQEDTVASGIRGTLDAKLKGILTRTGGGDGRYVRIGPRLRKIAGGVVTADRKTWFKGDDKQAGWTVYEVDGARGMDVSFHLESDSGGEADAKRPAQMLSIVSQVRAIARKYNVPEDNILYGGDANSEGLVVRTLAALGIRNAAAGTKYEDDRTFIGWDGESDKRFDYALTTDDSARVESVADDRTISDHAGIRVRRTLTR